MLHILLAGDAMLGRYVDQMLPHGGEHPRDPLLMASIEQTASKIGHPEELIIVSVL